MVTSLLLVYYGEEGGILFIYAVAVRLPQVSICDLLFTTSIERNPRAIGEAKFRLLVLGLSQIDMSSMLLFIICSEKRTVFRGWTHSIT